MLVRRSNLTLIQPFRKPKTRKGRKILLNREPKTIEDVKGAIFVEGRKTSVAVRNFLKDCCLIKKPNSKMMRHNNDFIPFDDPIPIEQ